MKNNRMQRLRRPSLRWRFAFSIAIAGLPLLLLGGAAFASLNTVVGALSEVIEEKTVETELIYRVEVAVLSSQNAVADYALSGETNDRRAMIRILDGVEDVFRHAERGPFALAVERRLIRQAHADWLQARDVSRRMPPPSPANSLDFMRAYDAVSDKSMRDLERLRDVISREAVAEQLYAAQVYDLVRLLVASVLAAGLGVIVITSALLARSISRPLAALGEGAGRLSVGDLSVRVVPQGARELSVLAASFNAMAEKLEVNQEIMEAAATHDFLTGAFNRRELYARLGMEMERARRYGGGFAFLMLDIDYLKAINDRHGHLTGDEALRRVADVLRECLRPVDMAGRFGGDEFAIIMPETTGPAACAAARRIGELVSAAIVFGIKDERLRFTVSLGVAVFPQHAESEEALIAHADEALMDAKKSGRNRCSLYAA